MINEQLNTLDEMEQLEQATQREVRLQEALHELVGQVEQAREGFGIYHNSPSMTKVLNIAKQVLRESHEKA
jgi:hypothetical protein